MFDRIKNRTIVLLGDDYNKQMFKEKHPSFWYSDSFDESFPIQTITTCYVVTGRTWKESAQRLEEKGLVFWEDIFPDWAEILIHDKRFFRYDELKKYTKNNIQLMDDILQYIEKYKKIATVYGNCQSLYVNMLLQKSEQFTKDYIMCVMPFIQNMLEERNTGIAEGVLKHFSCFIYQIAKRDNVFGEKLSTDVLLSLLKDDVKKCSIPFVYLSSYFPQYIKNTRNDDARRGEGHVPYGDIEIQSRFEAGKSVKQIVEELNQDALFDKKELQERHELSISELKIREGRCDIKISDYLEENYKSKCLFYSPSHPTNECLVELVYRIMKFFEYEEEVLDYLDVIENDRVEMYIYPSVKKHLNLTFKKDKFWLYKAEETKRQGIQEYVQEYKKYCFPELEEEFERKNRIISLLHMFELNEEIVEFRRIPVFEISGKSIHLSLYLTVKSDVQKGNLAVINPTYAPSSSYIFMAIAAITGQTYPCILYPSGEIVINGLFKKGTTVVIDTIYFKK